ncbi:FAD-binding domain protein [Gregarina niphandrodes]|uniref:FAD-binding domain protein n=1 Tax=Gregarina niphandrodes TaxID=110365 RepID=A0A023AZE1_GRENI|nr:FAD-binding domain protein [Gregarina niphandrodes]EZG43848.1 FAD-binding domain protein [Gregarina niphandrodes]|eukprot:XP_011132969.1 FAD-binding domain protein [Gregarina niphandrodes]
MLDSVTDIAIVDATRVPYPHGALNDKQARNALPTDHCLLNAESLEILNRFGLLEELTEFAKPVQGADIIDCSTTVNVLQIVKEVKRFSKNKCAKFHSGLVVEQWKLERYLMDHLSCMNVDFFRYHVATKIVINGTSMEEYPISVFYRECNPYGLDWTAGKAQSLPHTSSLDTVVVHSDMDLNTSVKCVCCRYLVGADGHYSIVRQAIKSTLVKLPQKSYEYLLIDVEAEEDEAENTIGSDANSQHYRILHKEQGACIVYSYAHPGKYRIITRRPKRDDEQYLGTPGQPAADDDIPEPAKSNRSMGGRSTEGRSTEGRSTKSRSVEGRSTGGRSTGGRSTGGRSTGGRSTGGRSMQGEAGPSNEVVYKAPGGPASLLDDTPAPGGDHGRAAGRDGAAEIDSWLGEDTDAEGGCAPAFASSGGGISLGNSACGLALGLDGRLPSEKQFSDGRLQKKGSNLQDSTTHQPSRDDFQPSRDGFQPSRDGLESSDPLSKGLGEGLHLPIGQPSAGGEQVVGSAGGASAAGKPATSEPWSVLSRLSSYRRRRPPTAQQLETIVSSLFGDVREITWCRCLSVDYELTEECAKVVNSRSAVFLVGSAARGCPPLWSGSLNMAVQDCYSLAWRLHSIVGWRIANQRLVQSYNRERVLSTYQYFQQQMERTDTLLAYQRIAPASGVRKVMRKFWKKEEQELAQDLNAVVLSSTCGSGQYSTLVGAARYAGGHPSGIHLATGVSAVPTGPPGALMGRSQSVASMLADKLLAPRSPQPGDALWNAVGVVDGGFGKLPQVKVISFNAADETSHRVTDLTDLGKLSLGTHMVLLVLRVLPYGSRVKTIFGCERPELAPRYEAKDVDALALLSRRTNGLPFTPYWVFTPAGEKPKEVVSVQKQIEQIPADLRRRVSEKELTTLDPDTEVVDALQFKFSTSERILAKETCARTGDDARPCGAGFAIVRPDGVIALKGLVTDTAALAMFDLYLAEHAPSLKP